MNWTARSAAGLPVLASVGGRQPAWWGLRAAGLRTRPAGGTGSAGRQPQGPPAQLAGQRWRLLGRTASGSKEAGNCPQRHLDVHLILLGEETTPGYHSGFCDFKFTKLLNKHTDVVPLAYQLQNAF